MSSVRRSHKAICSLWFWWGAGIFLDMDNGPLAEPVDLFIWSWNEQEERMIRKREWTQRTHESNDFFYHLDTFPRFRGLRKPYPPLFVYPGFLCVQFLYTFPPIMEGRSSSGKVLIQNMWLRLLCNSFSILHPSAKCKKKYLVHF